MIDIDHNTKTKQKIQLHGDVVRSADNIAKIGQEWDDLFARTHDAPAYLSRAWAETFISEKRIRGTPLLIVVWAGPELVALLPLSIRSFCGIRLAEPIGATEPSYLGLLADINYAGAVQAVADVWIRERVAHVFHDKYFSPLDSLTDELMVELARRGFVCKQGFRRVSPCVCLGCSFDDYFAICISSKSRHILRRKERRLFESGDVKIKYFAGEEVTPKIIDRIALVQKESWMKRRGAYVFGQPFYQKLLLKMAQAGLGCVWLMTIDGNDAAFQYAFIAHGKLYFRWTAFKLTYKSSLSIGQILMLNTIRDACSNGALSIDLGMGGSEYKQFWATDNHDVVMAVAGRGVLGYLIVLCYRAMWWLAKQKWVFSLFYRFRKWRNINKQRQHSVTEKQTGESG